MAPREGQTEDRDLYDRVVKLDIDVPREFYDPKKVLIAKLVMLRSLGYDFVDAYWKPSPSGKHMHIVIELDREVPISELFWLQFVLGDDPKRATFNFLRLKYFPDKAKYFNVLFDAKVEVTWKLKVRLVLRKILRSLKRLKAK